MRVRELLDQADRTEGTTVLLAEWKPPRRQKKIRTYKNRREGKLEVDLDAIAAEFPGMHVLFQTRSGGGVAATATWHVPGEPGAVPEVAGPGARLEPGAPVVRDLAAESSLTILLAELGVFSELRAENRLLAEKLRRVRTSVERLRMALATARAEKKEAVRARKRVETDNAHLRRHQSDDQAVLWVLRERLGDVFSEVITMVQGG
jgi:hypothetical protein